MYILYTYIQQYIYSCEKKGKIMSMFSGFPFFFRRRGYSSFASRQENYCFSFSPLSHNNVIINIYIYIYACSVYNEKNHHSSFSRTVLTLFYELSPSTYYERSYHYFRITAQSTVWTEYIYCLYGLI